VRPYTRVRGGFGTAPLSARWGWDRGLPIHRYYIEKFIREHAPDVKGRCLEFQEDLYVSRFGGTRLSRIDVLHIDDSNPKATIVADLTRSNSIPSESFDCIICTHVLHVIYEYPRALIEMRRILKPGGVLLVSVPHVSMCDPRFHELWRFTPEGLARSLAESFGAEYVKVTAYGNSLVAAGALRGLVAQEYRERELSKHDPRFAVEVCARALRPPRSV
jgi:SAM-dependent methyltransferase